MTKLLLGFFFLSFFLSNLSAQTFSLSGRVTGTDGRAVPFAAIYLKNTTKGTSANADGEYRLTLSLGKYEVVYRALNFKQEIKEINLQSSQRLNVVLINEAYELQTVTISGAEDPAYRIMRNTIKERKRHLEEVLSYTTDVYIKGVQKLLSAPKKFLGRDIDKVLSEEELDSNRTGIIYLSESESKFSFSRPDKIHEEMNASKVSGSNRSFSFNRASDMKFNFYENLSYWDELSARPMVSPIAENALFYYDYKLLGTIQENGETIHKIMVVPKRRADPVFRGNIYIIEGGWRIYSVNLQLTKESNLNFVDTLKIDQQFFPVSEKIWMPSGIKFEFTGGALGFRLGGYYIAVYKNYNINPALDKKEFVETLRITTEVNKKDSVYWLQNRPLPLTDEEKRDYIKKESIALKRESKPYLDSLDKVNNKFKIIRFLIGSGHNIRNRYEKETYSFSPLINSNTFFYNTVEGFALNYGVSYTKQFDTTQNRNTVFSGRIRYGFGNKKFHGSGSAVFPVKGYSLSVNLGSNVLDMNSEGGITTRANSINSLLYETNYQKFYQKKFLGATISGRISGGITATMGAEWASRMWLPNASDYTIRNLDDKAFSSNNPFVPALDVPLFPENQSLKLNIRFSYEFSKKYVTYPRGRYYLPSKYPRINLSYTKAINNVFGSDVDYDFISADISKSTIKLGLYGKTSFLISAGKYLNNSQLYYIDSKHFVGTQTLAFEQRQNAFLLLDYYLNSTADKYFEAHAEHNFSGFILNKIPLIRQLKLQEIIGANYLSTPALNNYSELYLGFKYLNFKGLYGMSFDQNNKLRSGFRIGYSLL